MDERNRLQGFFSDRMAVLVTIALLAVAAAPRLAQAQTPPPFPAAAGCPASPAPPADPWPIAAADTLNITGTSGTFSSATLLANDTGASLRVTAVGPFSSGGGSITGAGPFTFTAGAGFLGTDVFTYEITDATGQTAIGLVKVGAGSGVTVPVPNVVGLSQATAETRIIGAGLTAGITTANSATVSAGLVISQNPSANTIVGLGAAVTVVVSLGPTTGVTNVTMPNVVGLTQTAAQTAIVGAGLPAGTVSTVNSATVSAGLVIAQVPSAGASVPSTSAVSLLVSLGPASATVPNLVGLTQAAAQTAITGAGLSVGAVTTTTSATVASGQVISQSPAAGASVAVSSPVAFVVSLGPPPVTGSPVVDRTVFSDGAGTRTTPAFSTTGASDVLVAFAASDGPGAANGQTLTISGAGLTWTRVRRAATRFGVSEIWTAKATTVLTNVTVTSTQATAGFDQSLTVVAFSGASGIGASNVGGAVGAPTVNLVAQADGSVVYAVGNDWDGATPRTIPAGQTKVHEFVDTAKGDTFWVQAANATTTAAGQTVTLNATAPSGDQWNLAIVEVKR